MLNMKKTGISSTSGMMKKCCLSKVAAAVMVSLTCSTSVTAIEFSLSDDWYGSFDSTISYGISYRVEDRDENLIGKYNNDPVGIFPGNGITPVGAWSNNIDDGNLNFDTGIFSNVLKGTHELDFQYAGKFGVFARATWFYDTELEDNDREFRQLTDAALNQHGSDIEMLDAYFWASFDVGDKPAQIRAGEMVVNWGESTFIQHSISEANPLDLAKLRVPGSELKEAFIPVQTLWGTIDLSDSFTLEAYVQFEWEHVDLDAPGTYFSTNDFLGEGGEVIWLNFGQVADIPNDQYGTDLPPEALALVGTSQAFRESDREADDDGQWGVRLGWYSEALNSTEFGFYYINYHNKRPIISANGHNGRSVTGFAEYLEDIELYGVSFNTVVQGGFLEGLSIAGEFSYRQDEPLQIDDIELLFEALEPIGGVALGTSQIPGTVRPGEEISGYRLFDTMQFQTTFTQLLGPRFGASQSTFLLEAGATYIDNLPDQDELRFDAPGTPRSANPAREGNGFAFLADDDAVCATSASDHTTGEPILVQCEGLETNEHGEDFSWGYRMLFSLNYNDVFAGWNATPRIVFQHDVKGTTPSPIANFIEDRKSVGISVAFDYQSVWRVNTAYNIFTGGGTANLLSDRDFASINVSYSF